MLRNLTRYLVSGIRPNCEVLVYIDLKAVVREGIKFFRGDDGVLWSDGNKQGVIPPKFFLYAVHISPTTGQQIYNEDLSGKFFFILRVEFSADKPLEP